MKKRVAIRASGKIICVALLFFLSLTCTSRAQALLQLGTQAPDFSLTELKGSELTLARYEQSKALVLVFWSTWSGKSKDALKRFGEFYQGYRGKGLEVIGVNVDSQIISEKDLEKIRETATAAGVTFPVAADKELKTFRSYDVIAVPSTVVIAGGKIAYELSGLPLIGTEDLFEYLRVTAGEEPRKKVESGYRPRHDAIADTGAARKFVKRQKYDLAYPLFKKAIEKDPRYLVPYLELAKLYALNSRDTEAEEMFLKALNIEPESVVVMSDFGYFLTKTGRTKQALELLEKAVRKNSYTPAHYYYGYALGRDGRIQEALKALEDAQSLNPYEPMLYLLRAEIQETYGALPAAAADYRKHLELVQKTVF